MRPAAPDSPTPLLIVSGWAGGDTVSFASANGTAARRRNGQAGLEQRLNRTGGHAAHSEAESEEQERRAHMRREPQ
eukprot:9194271-Pyramimonas_sp.AAC.1